MRAGIVALACGLAAARAGTAPDGEALPPAARASMRSTGRRFVVSGEDAAQRTTLARWADDIHRRFREDWIPQRPLAGDWTFGIVIDPGPGFETGRAIERHARIEGRRLRQMARIVDPENIDAEEFAEAVSAMLINALFFEERYGDASPEEDFEEIAPAWLTAGVAQSLYPFLRTRNQALTLELWRGGRLPDAAAILSWRHLPPHRTFEKAVSGVWALWAADAWPQRGDALRHWIESAGAGEGLIDPDVFFDAAADARAPGDWEPHVASLQRLLSAAETLDAAARFERLRAALSVTPGSAGLPAGLDVPPDAGLDALRPWRRMSWFGPFARARRGELAVLAMGADPEYRDLVRRAGGFLDALEGRRPGFLLRRDYGRLRDDIDAREAMAVLREQYVDIFEKEHARDGYARDGGTPVLPPSRMRRYVDAFDKP